MATESSNGGSAVTTLQETLYKEGDFQTFRGAESALSSLCEIFNIDQDSESASLHIARIKEAFRRLCDHSQVCMSLPFFLQSKVASGELSPHEAKLAAIEYFGRFFMLMYAALVGRGIIDQSNTENLPTLVNDVARFCEQNDTEKAHLEALIVEIFCSGNVTFSVDALPPYLRKRVLAERGRRGAFSGH